MALLTVAEVAAAAGITITAGSVEEDQAQFFCDQIEAYIAEVVGVLFTNTTITERVQADYDGVVTLRYSPVNEVTSVKKPDGATRVGWDFDGLAEIDYLEAHEVVDVTYKAGYTAPPDALKKVAIAAAARQVVNPAGKRQITVGAISETFAAGDGAAGTMFFTPLELEIISRYGQTATTWRLGPRSRAWRPTLPELYP